MDEWMQLLEPYLSQHGAEIKGKINQLRLPSYPSKDLFAPFSLPIQDVRVVVVLPEPPAMHKMQEGRPLTETRPSSPLTRAVMREAHAKYWSTLSKWQQSGVFVMNWCWTTSYRHPGIHAGIWDGFSRRVLVTLADYHLGGNRLVFLFLTGDHPYPVLLSGMRRFRHAEIVAPHPLDTKFAKCGCFTEANDIIVKKFLQPAVNWSLPDNPPPSHWTDNIL